MKSRQPSVLSYVAIRSKTRIQNETGKARIYSCRLGSFTFVIPSGTSASRGICVSARDST